MSQSLYRGGELENDSRLALPVLRKMAYIWRERKVRHFSKSQSLHIGLALNFSAFKNLYREESSKFLTVLKSIKRRIFGNFSFSRAFIEMEALNLNMEFFQVKSFKFFQVSEPILEQGKCWSSPALLGTSVGNFPGIVAAFFSGEGEQSQIFNLPRIKI